MHKHPALQRGVTLIELLTSVCIAGILAAAGAPALGSMLARSHTQAAANGLEASLLHAREAAIEARVNILVCPSADHRTCAPNDWQGGWLVARDADGDRKPDRGVTPLAAFDALPKNLRVIASSGRPLIVFRPDGSAAGSNAQLTVCDSGETRRGTAVIIANSGRVRTTAATAARLAACLR